MHDALSHLQTVFKTHMQDVRGFVLLSKIINTHLTATGSSGGLFC